MYLQVRNEQRNDTNESYKAGALLVDSLPFIRLDRGNSSNSLSVLTLVSVLAQVMPFPPTLFSSPCSSPMGWINSLVPGFNCGLLSIEELAFLNG